MANSAKENDAQVASLEREVQQLRKMVGRSRSPRMQPRHKALPAPPQQLALPALQPAKRHSEQTLAPRMGKTTVAGTTMLPQAAAATRTWSMKATKLFHQSNRDNAICSIFRNASAQTRGSCNRRHVCIGCAKKGKPHNECHCLQSRLN